VTSPPPRSAPAAPIRRADPAALDEARPGRYDAMAVRGFCAQIKSDWAVTEARRRSRAPG
jgi:hypothetical protein